MLAAPDTFDDLEDLLADDLVSDGMLLDALEGIGTGRDALLPPSVDAAMDAGHLLADAKLSVPPTEWLDYLEYFRLPYRRAVQYVELAALGVSVEEAVARGGITPTLRYRRPRAIDALTVLEIVGDRYSVSVEDLKSHRHGNALDFPRQVVGYVLLESGYGPAGVGRMLDGRRHSAVQVAHWRVAERIAERTADGHAELKAVREIRDALHLAAPPAAADPDARRARLAESALRDRERYKSDPEFAERKRQSARQYRSQNADNLATRDRERYKSDPEFAERKRQSALRYYAENAESVNRRRQEKRANDPDYAESVNRRRREKMANDPDYAERRRQRSRDWRAANPDRVAEYQRRQEEQLAANPDKAAEYNRRRQEKRANDPDYAESVNRRRREKRANDPDYAERQRQRSRDWRAANPDRVAEYNRRRQEKRANDPDYANAVNRRRREKRANDPDYANAVNRRRREKRANGQSTQLRLW